ncbi:MAG: PhoH family protein [Pirellulaceae bacterium]|jgi:phosphate starvation-inducible PhoH-like protein|nr:PhoH family protein [Pirellulaceae bacterium]MDP6555646.1 PhoH family protein [Pirellulaceae bacterium]
MTEATLSLVEPELVLSLFGACDQHLRTVREALGVSIAHRDGEVRVMGDESAVALATEVLELLKAIAERRGTLGEDDVARVIASVVGHDDRETQPTIDVIEVTQTIKPRTAGQARYIEAIRKHDVVFSAGPAGTGKTYLAVALAVEALKNQEIHKIVLVRPAVEAGESLGFLPGDLRAKINPYLRPLLDALHEMIDYDQIQRFMEQDVIEVVPLAYMRGRTLNSAFIILDEAQNTTIAQMKMFLTRMGEGSRIVIAGDPTQVDLPPHARSGLIDALSRLRAVRGIAQIQLSRADIVRHRLVQDIVNAYEESPRGSSKKSRR